MGVDASGHRPCFCTVLADDRQDPEKEGTARGEAGKGHPLGSTRLPSSGCLPQMGPNAKELFRLVEDFVDVIGFRMKDLRDAYQVTDNLGKPALTPLALHACPAAPRCLSASVFPPAYGGVARQLLPPT